MDARVFNNDVATTVCYIYLILDLEILKCKKINTKLKIYINRVSFIINENAELYCRKIFW